MEPGDRLPLGRGVPTLYFNGCDVGDYKVKIDRARAAQAGGASVVEIASGLPGTVLVFKGSGGAPRVALRGPRGERIASAADGSPSVRGDDYLVIEDARAALTHVLIAKPSGGRWEVDTLDGSPPIVEVQARQAGGLGARVVRAGELRYRLTPRAGQKVTFVERGGSAGGELGVARGASGTLRFRPADGAPGRRSIVALIEQDGALRDEVEVAPRAAPRPASMACACAVPRLAGAVAGAVPLRGARRPRRRARDRNPRRAPERARPARRARVRGGARDRRERDGRRARHDAAALSHGAPRRRPRPRAAARRAAARRAAARRAAAAGRRRAAAAGRPTPPTNCAGEEERRPRAGLTRGRFGAPAGRGLGGAERICRCGNISPHPLANAPSSLQTASPPGSDRDGLAPRLPHRRSSPA